MLIRRLIPEIKKNLDTLTLQSVPKKIFFKQSNPSVHLSTNKKDNFCNKTHLFVLSLRCPPFCIVFMRPPFSYWVYDAHLFLLSLWCPPFRIEFMITAFSYWVYDAHLFVLSLWLPPFRIEFMMPTFSYWVYDAHLFVLSLWFPPFRIELMMPTWVYGAHLLNFIPGGLGRYLVPVAWVSLES